MIADPPWRTGRGFTLIEVVVVLLVMGLAVGVALPMLGSGAGTLRGTAAARRVVSYLNGARHQAVNTGEPVTITYDFESRVFARGPGTKGWEREDLPLPRGVRVVSMGPRGREAREESASLTFYPLGDSSGSLLALEDEEGRGWTVSVGVLFAAPVLTTDKISR